MKTAIALLFIIAAIAHSVYSEENPANAKSKNVSVPFKQECIDESGVNKALVDEFNQAGLVPKDENMEKYLKCVLTKNNLIDDHEKLQIDNVVKQLNIVDPVLVKKLIKNCDPPRSDVCRAALLKNGNRRERVLFAKLGASLLVSLKAHLAAYFSAS